MAVFHGSHDETANEHRGLSHDERGTATGHGFIAVGFVLVLLARGEVLLWQALAHGYPASGVLVPSILSLIPDELTLITGTLYT